LYSYPVKHMRLFYRRYMEMHVNREILKYDFSKTWSIKATWAAQIIYKVCLVLLMLILFVVMRLCMWCCCGAKKQYKEKQTAAQEASTSANDVRGTTHETKKSQ